MLLFASQKLVASLSRHRAGKLTKKLIHRHYRDTLKLKKPTYGCTIRDKWFHHEPLSNYVYFEIDTAGVELSG